MCRPLDYYVNPDSEEIMELGTMQFPFRDINLVFTEIYNEHQHTDRVINVYVMEATDNYLPMDYIEILNVTQVNIDSYSQNDKYEAENINFKIVDSIDDVSMNTSKSLFNVIQNQFKGDFDTSRMTEGEINEITFQSYTVFLVYRSSVSLNHINIYSEFTNENVESLLIYTSYCFEKTQALLNMYMDIKGSVYLNTYATTNVYAENITLNMSQSTGGFWYESSCNFEGDLNLAEHVYKNIYTFTDSQIPIITGVIVTAGNCNTTISNITIQVYISYKLSSTILGSTTTTSCTPQDDVLQFFNVDNVYSTMPENPAEERAGYISIFTPTGSTRQYLYTIKDSTFNERNYDPEFIYLITGQFIESLILSNITHTNSLIADRIFAINLVLNISIDNIALTNNSIFGDYFILLRYCIIATVDNIVFENNTLSESTTELMRVTGLNSVFQSTNFYVSNSDLLSSSGLRLQGTFMQIAITGVNADSLTIDTDGSILKIELATILQASLFNFTNIHSYDSDSSNNYMISITAMDLTASYPSVIQNITVSNSTTSILNVQSVTGNLSDNNALVVQNVYVSECNIYNNIDMITLSSLTTYDLYAIIFSNLVFQNLEFTQNANLFNFGHLLSVPVQITHSTFSNIKGAKININSFTTEISNLNTVVSMDNITVSEVNAKFDSFIELRTGAVLSINNSVFSDVS